MEVSTELDLNVDLNKDLNVNLDVNSNTNLKKEDAIANVSSNTLNVIVDANLEQESKIPTPYIKTVTLVSRNEAKIDSQNISPQYVITVLEPQDTEKEPKKCDINKTWLIMMILFSILFLFSLAIGTFAVYVSMNQTVTMSIHIQFGTAVTLITVQPTLFLIVFFVSCSKWRCSKGMLASPCQKNLQSVGNAEVNVELGGSTNDINEFRRSKNSFGNDNKNESVVLGLGSESNSKAKNSVGKTPSEKILAMGEQKEMNDQNLEDSVNIMDLDFDGPENLYYSYATNHEVEIPKIEVEYEGKTCYLANDDGPLEIIVKSANYQARTPEELLERKRPICFIIMIVILSVLVACCIGFVIYYLIEISDITIEVTIPNWVVYVIGIVLPLLSLALLIYAIKKCVKDTKAFEAHKKTRRGTKELALEDKLTPRGSDDNCFTNNDIVKTIYEPKVKANANIEFKVSEKGVDQQEGNS